jgi:hypothetical protein
MVVRDNRGVRADEQEYAGEGMGDAHYNQDDADPLQQLRGHLWNMDQGKAGVKKETKQKRRYEEQRGWDKHQPPGT